MAITFDPAKRTRTLAERGLDFEQAEEVFEGDHITIPDDRFDYGEERWVTFGFLGGRLIVTVWTPRGEDRRIISMRKASNAERARYAGRLG